jgi:hypothetical protein
MSNKDSFKEFDRTFHVEEVEEGFSSGTRIY